MMQVRIISRSRVLIPMVFALLVGFSSCGSDQNRQQITTIVEYQIIHDTIYTEPGNKVNGIGGIFFKSENPIELKSWYHKHLGINTDQWGSNFLGRSLNNPEKRTYLQWSPFHESTTYFSPSSKEFMINYRVKDLDLLVEELRTNDVLILDSMLVVEYGKFIHILDPEGNKIELWEPIYDSTYNSYVINGATY